MCLGVWWRHRRARPRGPCCVSNSAVLIDIIPLQKYLLIVLNVFLYFMNVQLEICTVYLGLMVGCILFNYLGNISVSLLYLFKFS